MNEQLNDGLIQDFLAGGSEMGALMRSIDWSKTPLGPLAMWPQSLRTSVTILLASRFPMIIFWGPELVQLYNDTYRPILGATKHPAAMGQPAQECWPEVWDIIGPMLQGVLANGEATWSDNQLLLLNRNGYVEECYFTFSYSPIRDETGKVCGVFCAVTETSGHVLGERRLRTLRELAADTARAKTIDEVARVATTSLASNPNDLPFALVYLIDESGKQVNLAGNIGIEPGVPLAPLQISLESDSSKPVSWPVSRVGQTRQAEMVMGLNEQFGPFPLSVLSTSQAPHSALVLPLAPSGDTQLRGVLIIGLSPFRVIDDEYQGFVQLVADSITTALMNVRAYQEERKRAESLAQLDRAKTVFFSNVSHEFRTPLTLMLGPLEEALTKIGQDTPEQQRERLQMIQRNSLRLLKLVNNLLDFSRIEAGRIKASYELTDLSAYTAELASIFRSAIEQAGLEFIVDCPPMPESAKVYIDREMWEKIVLNLLSNAFKFTLQGKICVRLNPVDDHLELEIEDTGTGISSEELPHLFERFYQGHGAPSRAYEGSGIGLALVQELVKLQGGTIWVQSEMGQGTTFTVSIPLGKAHLPPERIGSEPIRNTNAPGSTVYIEEALRWLPDSNSSPGSEDSGNRNNFKPTEIERRHLGQDQTHFDNSTFYILVADDNADMRDYLQRLLTSETYRVKTVADGQATLSLVQAQAPDLIISDVMMPGVDGFALLKELRSDPATALIPIILLSARAGEEAVVEGMATGADDYLVKPFSAQELLARVQATLKLAQLRKELIYRERTARAQAELLQERMLGLFKEAPFFTCILRGPTYIFEFANDLYLQLVNHKDIVGKPLREALNEPAYEPFYQLLDEVYRSGVSFIGKEILFPKLVRYPGGEPEDAYLNFIYQAIRDANGQVDGILVHGVDVTEQVVARQRSDFLANASTLLAASLDYESTLTTIAGLAVPELAHWCIVDILDPDKTIRRVAVTHSDPDKTELAQELKNLIPDPDKAHPVTIVLNTRQPTFQPDMQTSPKEALFGHSDYWEIAAKMGMSSRIIVPMLAGDRVLGAISLIYSRPGRQYNEKDLQFAQELARRAATAIENARLYQAEQQTNERLRRLQAVTTAFSKVLTAEQVANIIVEQGLAALNASAGFVALVSKDGTVLRIVQSFGYSPEVTQAFQDRPLTDPEPASETARTGQPIWLESLEAILARYPHLGEGQERTGNKAIVALPLVVEERVLGVLAAGFKNARVFSQEERNFMLALSQQCAQALERTRLYEEAQQALETQKELDTLKDLFISMASHELRNPLASIKGFGQVMQRALLGAAKASPTGQERRGGQDKLLRPLENILRQTNRMNELIRQLLDFSRLQNDKLELNLKNDVNLVELAGQVIEQQQAATENKRNLVLQAEQASVMGSWDADRVEQVLTNLISNAIKYSPPDKPIVVGVAPCPLSSESAKDQSEQAEVVVWVKDEGQGISPEHQANLFDRFYRVRTKENVRVEGLGLGLYISHEIVRQHGGRMWVESEVGKGSTFYFSLPLKSRTTS